MEIHEFDRIELIDGLSKQLADVCTLRLKTEGICWNFSEAIPNELPQTLLLQFAALGSAAGEIAGCMGDLGAKAPCSYQQFSGLVRINEELGAAGADQVIARLATDHEALTQTAITLLLVAREANYAPLPDLLRRHIRMHQKAAEALGAEGSVVLLD